MPSTEDLSSLTQSYNAVQNITGVLLYDSPGRLLYSGAIEIATLMLMDLCYCSDTYRDEDGHVQHLHTHYQRAEQKVNTVCTNC